MVDSENRFGSKLFTPMELEQAIQCGVTLQKKVEYVQDERLSCFSLKLTNNSNMHPHHFSKVLRKFHFPNRGTRTGGPGINTAVPVAEKHSVLLQGGYGL